MPSQQSLVAPARLQQVLLPVAQSMGLPNVTYTRTEYFFNDRDVVIGRTWAGLTFVDLIPGKPFAQPVEFMGLPMLVTRDRDGVLRVFHNVCSHRGMKLVADPTEIRGLLSCRYHCWSYTAEGALKSTPHIGGVNCHESADFDKKGHGLKEVRSAQFLGVLFINLSGDAPDFDKHIAPLKERVGQLVGEQGVNLLHPGVTDSAMTITVRCNWKLAVENYCEAYHLPWVHPALNAYSRLEDHYCFLDGTNFAGQGSLAYRLSEVAGTRLPRFDAWPTDRTHVAEYPALYPNVLLGFHADHAFAVLLTPVTAELTREELRIYYVGAGASAGSYSSCRESILSAWRVVFSEDVFAVEGMQQGRRSPGYDGGVFSPAMDGPIHHFHVWIAERLARGAPSDIPRATECTSHTTTPPSGLAR